MMRFFMKFSIEALSRLISDVSIVFNAYSLKMYLCVPLGGHGPEYSVLPPVFIPCLAF